MLVDVNDCDERFAIVQGRPGIPDDLVGRGDREAVDVDQYGGGLVVATLCEQGGRPTEDLLGRRRQ